MLEVFLAVAGLIAVAAITPGPNNFIVLERSLRGGLVASLPAILGVIVGTQALLFVIWIGAGGLFEQEPRLREALTFAGAAYLFWLGLSVIRRSFGTPQTGEVRASGLAASFSGLLLFQFLNPKSWVLVITATAALSAGLRDFPALISLALLFFSITGTCLLLWAVAGASLTRFLSDPLKSRWFDRAMGASLMGSAALLLL